MNSVASGSKPTPQQQHQNRLHARQQLALVVTLDSILLLLVFVALLLSDFDGYDMLFLALHLPHIFTVLLAYVIVHYSSGAVDVLRMLVLFYLIAAIIDCFVALARLGFLVHADRHAWLGELVRLFIAGVFVFTDIGGAIFADVARSLAYSFALRTDEQLQAFSQRFVDAPPMASSVGMEKSPV